MSEHKQWIVDNAHASKNAFKKYRKNHPKEFISCFANLQKIVELLNAGSNLAQVDVSFFRSEGSGLWRIGQSKVKHAHETRLYTYIYEGKHTLYLLKIGDKNGQQADINDCKKIIQKIPKQKHPTTHNDEPK